MAGFDGNGNYIREHDWTDDKDNGIYVRADRMDEEFDTMATSFEECLTRDGQGKPSADIDWNNKKITNIADPTTAKGVLNIQTAQAGTYHYTITAGSANAYTGSLVPSIAAMTNGMVVAIRANHSNTGASTFNLNGLGAKNIYANGLALVGGEIISGGYYLLSYNGTDDRWQIDKPTASETLKGLVELATTAETVTGTDTTLATHSAGVRSAIASIIGILGDKPTIKVSNDTDTEHDILFSAGAAIDSTKAYILKLASAMSKRIDANWSAGTGNGGFPSGISLSTSTWYHLFVIGKTDGTVDAGFDSSLTATNLLATATGYTLYRRVGSFKTDASSNIVNFTQFGDWFLYKTRNIDVSLTTLATTKTNLTLASVPLGIATIAKCLVGYSDASSTAAMWIGRVDFEDVAPLVGDTTTQLAAKNIQSHAATPELCNTLDILINTSQQIAYRTTSSSAVMTIIVLGYMDTLA